MTPMFPPPLEGEELLGGGIELPYCTVTELRNRDSERCRGRATASKGDPLVTSRQRPEHSPDEDEEPPLDDEEPPLDERGGGLGGGGEGGGGLGGGGEGGGLGGGGGTYSA